MNRLLNTSSITGSALVPIALAALAAARRASARDGSCAVISACQPGSTTMVWCGSMMRAGPSTLWPGVSCSRVIDARPRAIRRCEKNCVRRGGRGRACRAWSCASSRGTCAPPPTASTDDRLDDQLLVSVDEAEARLVRRLEGARSSSASVPASTDQRACRCRRSGYARATMHGDRRRSARPGRRPRPAHVLAEPARRSRLIAASALPPSGSSIACWRVARISARPMP